MLIISIRTDKPESEIGLFDGVEELAYYNWTAHRQLAETLHKKIEEVLDKAGKTIKDLEGIVAYQGPGSFTGLRIGLSVCNAIAYSMDIPVVGVNGEEWQQKGIAKLLKDENNKVVMPEYGGDAHITKPRK